ncbi:MAG: host-nuclease inhibitor Gam family protein [Rectinemataceae bacterium]
MQAAVLDRTEPASVPLDLPSSILYPDFSATLDLGSSPSLSSPVPVDSSESSDMVAPAFIVDSLAKADWAVARVLEAEARIARRAALAANLHERIDAWLTKSSSTDNDSIVYISSLLRPFVESELAMQRRSRSLILPSGVAQLRKLPDKLDIVDKDAALSYCESSHPEAVIIKKDLSKTELKRLVFSGTAIPGVSAELGSDELYIRANT